MIDLCAAFALLCNKLGQLKQLFHCKASSEYVRRHADRPHDFRFDTFPTTLRISASGSLRLSTGMLCCSATLMADNMPSKNVKVGVHTDLSTALNASQVGDFQASFRAQSGYTLDVRRPTFSNSTCASSPSRRTSSMNALLSTTLGGWLDDTTNILSCMTSVTFDR